METTIFASAQARSAVSAEAAWRVLQQYGDLGWAVGIEEVELVTQGVTQVRRVRLAGSEGWIDERLLSFDAQNRTLRYGIDGASMGVLVDYEARAEILNRADGCVVCWRCRANPIAGQEGAAQAVLDRLAENIVNLFAAQFANDSTRDEDVPG